VNSGLDRLKTPAGVHARRARRLLTEHGPREDGVFATTSNWSGICSTTRSRLPPKLGCDANSEIQSPPNARSCSARRSADGANCRNGWWIAMTRRILTGNLSHLVALHPGHQIAPRTTPQLANAAKVSLNARGDVSTGWSTRLED